MKSFVHPKLLLAAATLVAASSASATTETWNAASGNWSTANWSGASTSFTNNDDAVFSAATGNSAITLDQNFTVGNIFSNGATNTPGTMTITGTAGRTLTLGTGTAGTGNIYDNVGGSSIGYAGNLTYNGANTTAGTFFQLAAGSGTSGSPTIWNMASGKTLAISAKTAGDVADFGGNTVNLTGAGTVAFGGGGSSVFRNGTFNVNAGTLNLQGGGGVVPNYQSSLSIVVSGGTLRLTPNTGGTAAGYNELVTLNGGTLQDGAGAVGGTAMQSGMVTVGTGTNTISNQTGTGLFKLENLVGSGNVSFTGLNNTSGTLIEGTSTFSGNATVGSGILQFAKAAVFYNSTSGAVSGANAAKLTVTNGGAFGAVAAFNVGGTGEFTSADIDTILGASTGTVGFLTGSVIGFDTTNAAGGNFTYATNLANPTGSTSLGLMKLGTNTLTLTGANTYTGKTFINGGVLQISAENNLGVTPGAAVADQLTLNGGTLKFGAITTLSANRGVALASGTSTIDTGGFSSTINGIVSGVGALTIAGAGTVTMGTANTFTGALTVNSGATLNFNFAAGTTYAGSISGAGTIKLINTSFADTRTLSSANNTFTGTLNISRGTTTLSAANANWSGTNFGWTPSSNDTADTLSITGVGTTKIGSISGLVSGSVSIGATTTVDVTSGNISTVAAFGGSVQAPSITGVSGAKITSSSGTLTLATGNALTIDANTAIVNATTGVTTLSLVKTGAGTLTLSGASTYTGGTSVNAGTLVTGHTSALGSGAVTLGGGTLQVGATNLTGIASLTVNTGKLDTSAGSITLTGAGAFALNGGTWLIGNALDAIKLTSGTFTLSGGTIDLLNFTNKSVDGGVYSLISGSGTSSLTNANFVNGTAGFNYALDTNGDLHVSAVPEPGTYGLIGAGALAAAALVRRRRHRDTQA